MSEKLKTIRFAIIICVICSLALASVKTILSDIIELNKKNDKQTKILKVFGERIVDDNGNLIVPAKELETIFNKKIQSFVLDANGQVTSLKITDLTKEDINKRNTDGVKKYYPLYVFKMDSGKIRYGIHISGMGLWSVVKGYIALEDDCATIAGITFYEHEETPGLGGEIDKDFFQKRFKGKILSSNYKQLQFSILKKGQVINNCSIDGISGATMTCRGVSNFINQDFKIYNKYFENLH